MSQPAERAQTDDAPETIALPPPRGRHAVWCLPLNMGSCNGCDQQILALGAARYQLTRRGIAFAASPRHADIVLLTGALTRRSLEPVRRTLALVPDPHAVIAVGDCAINGGVFAGSPLLVAETADLLGVNIEIAGNPPSPAQILQAIEKAADLLDHVDDDDAADSTPADAATDDAEADADETGDDADADETGDDAEDVDVVEEDKRSS